MCRRLLAGIGMWLGLMGTLPGQLAETDTLRLGWKASLDGSWITGNVDRLLLRSQAELYHRGKLLALSTSNSYQFGTFAGFRTENDLFSRNFLYHRPERKLYPYLMVWLETNLRRRLSFRVQSGPGLSWRLRQKTGQLLKASAMLTYEHNHFKGSGYSLSEYDGTAAFGIWRLTGRLFGKHRIGKQGLGLRWEVWGQFAPEMPENYRLHADLALRVPLNRRVSFRTGFNYNYESLYLTGVKPRDTFMFLGIALGNSN